MSVKEDELKMKKRINQDCIIPKNKTGILIPVTTYRLQ
jgi:hypothetical protein